MTHPLKKAGFAQGIHTESVTCKEMIGTYRQLRDGRGFRYGYASEIIGIGKMSHATRSSTNHLDQAVLAAVAIGEYTLDLTVTYGTALAENELRGGYFQIQSGVGLGQNLLIASNSEISSAEASIHIQIALDDPIQVALDATSQFSLLRSEWFDCQISTTSENFATGVPPITLTALYYAWFQTHGPCNVLNDGAIAIGAEVILSATEGAVEEVSSAKAVDVPTIGYKTHAASTTTEYCPVFLTID